MTWTNRLKLWGGVLAVLALGLGLTLLFNQRQHQAASTSAHIDAPVTIVGSDYGGVVSEVFVSEGDRVTAGQKLFTLTSLTLQQDLGNGLKPAATPAYDIEGASGRITYKAVADGYIADLAAQAGTFLPNGHQMARVVADGRRTVIADFPLDPVDYGRVEPDASVRIFLPDNRAVDGTVSTVSVETVEGRSVARVRVSSDTLVDPALATLTRQDTPVLAVLQLRDDGPLAGPTQSMLSFLARIGLR